MDSSNSETPKWLRKIQENSWEAEILISGGAIFSLFQLSNGLLWLYDYLKSAWVFPGLDEGMLLAMVASKGLTIGFIIHLILRAYWIALICTHFAFIDRNDDRIETLQSKIVALDKTAGLFFATSIFFVIFIIGLYVILSIPSIAIEFTNSRIGFILVLSIEALWLMDILTSEKIRNLKFAKPILKYPFWLLDRLSLSFLYARPILDTFQNFGWRKSAVIATCFSLVTLLFAFADARVILDTRNPFDRRQFTKALSKNRIYSSYHYQNESEGVFIRPQIQSSIVTDDFLRIQVGYSQWNDQFIYEKGASTYSELLELQLNDSTLRNTKWMGMQPKVNESRYAVVAFVDIRHLQPGEQLLIIRSFRNSKMETIAEIPFWKNN